MRVITYTDGGARGNPGPAGIGIVVKDAATGQNIEAFGRYIGETTNNQAEYQALVAALETAIKHGATEAHCFLDSELIVKQMNREYRVRDVNLQPHFLKIWNMAGTLQKCIFTHIPRAKNAEADKLVNEAIDKRLR